MDAGNFSHRLKNDVILPLKISILPQCSKNLKSRYNTMRSVSFTVDKSSETMAETVQLFITCLVDTLYPATGEAVVRILERAGVNVAFPLDQTCCGQPPFNAGLRQQALPMARHTIRVFENTSGAVVIPSGSCAAMIRHGYLELFADDPQWLPRARRLAERVYELSEFLVDILGVSDLGARFAGRLAYHRSCHLLRDLGVDRQPMALLQSIQQAEVVELSHSDECCGFGGVFSAEQAELSSAMLRRKLAHILASGAERIVACDAGCITNINGGLQRLGQPPCAVHLADILDHP
jgi:L-lactate dehydrogenase complex protein LldE